MQAAPPTQTPAPEAPSEAAGPVEEDDPGTFVLQHSAGSEEFGRGAGDVVGCRTQ